MTVAKTDSVRRLVDLCRASGSPRRALVESLRRCAADDWSASEIDLLIIELRKRPDLPSIVGTAYGRLNRDLKRPTHGLISTPPWLAAEVVSHLRLGLPVVDLGAGSGVLTLAAARRGFHVTAIEQDSNLATILDSLATLAGLRNRIDIRVGDALQYSRRSPAQIVSNPPFTRHHSIPRWKKEELADLALSLEMPLRQTSGYYAYFLAYAWSSSWSLRDVFVLPTNWLETRYGDVLRERLSHRAYRLRIIENGDHAPVFDRALTTVCVLTSWPERAGVQGSRLSTVSLEPHTESGILTGGPGAPSRAEGYGSMTITKDGHPSVSSPAPVGSFSSSARCTLGEVFRVKRGLATGCNSFFVLTKKQAEGSGIRSAELVKIARGLGPHGVTTAFLWSPAMKPSLNSMRRVRQGVRLGVSERYLCSHRTPWWRVDLPFPPDYFLSYMGRGKARIIPNRGRVLNLNNIHGLYIQPGISSAIARRVVVWLSTSEGVAALSRCVRHYYDGMWKLEPKDAERIPLGEKLLEPASARRAEEPLSGALAQSIMSRPSSAEIVN